MNLRQLMFVVPALVAAGCFTLKESEPVSVQMAGAPKGREVKVAVAGFAANFTDYVSVYGHNTYFVPGPYHHGHLETVTTQTLVPQVRASEMFVKRAQTVLEDCGYLLRATPADYTVEVNFAGPFVSDSERGVSAAWMFLSVLSAEYSTQTWSAKLRIYDKGGRVVFPPNYSQKYEYCVWSPLFFIGLAGVTKDEPSYMQTWCLTMLTDRALADATAFLAARK